MENDVAVYRVKSGGLWSRTISIGACPVVALTNFDRKRNVQSL